MQGTVSAIALAVPHIFYGSTLKQLLFLPRITKFTPHSWLYLFFVRHMDANMTDSQNQNGHSKHHVLSIYGQ